MTNQEIQALHEYLTVEQVALVIRDFADWEALAGGRSERRLSQWKAICSTSKDEQLSEMFHPAMDKIMLYSIVKEIWKRTGIKKG